MTPPSSISARRPSARALALVTLGVLAGALSARPAAAQRRDSVPAGVSLGLNYDPRTKPGVIVLPIAGASGDSLRAIFERDFDYGDRIAVVRVDAPAPVNGKLNYPLLARLGAAVAVQATVTPTGVRVALHDVAKRAVAQTRSFALTETALAPAWRMAVHTAADDLESAITGTRGIAATRIAFTREGRIYVVDSDGANPRPITPEGALALSPAWHPTGKYVAYSGFGRGGGTQVFIRDLAGTSARPVVATPGGLNITPAFSPDGNTVVYAHGLDAGTDLIAASAFDNAPGRRVTVGRGSENVSPSFSPDGRRLVFTSGRSGHPEVYITDADGTNAELLTPFVFGETSYRSNPDWSPTGSSVAFQAQIAGRFQIATISLRDREIKQLTSEGSNEDPSWAPDGRHLVFTSTRGGTRQLWVHDAETGRARQLTRGAVSRLPAWSRSLAVSPNATSQQAGAP
jgi:TolB protein